MTQSRSLLVLLVALAFSVSFAVPVADDPETPYDESESLPYESSPAVSVAEPEAAAPALVGQPRVVRLPRGCPRRTSGLRLGHRTGWAYPICNSLTILDLTLRC
jgi:hypothetical protein